MTVQNIMYTIYNFFVVAFFMDLDPDFPDRFRIFGRSGLRKKVRSGPRSETLIFRSSISKNKVNFATRAEKIFCLNSLRSLNLKSLTSAAGSSYLSSPC